MRTVVARRPRRSRRARASRRRWRACRRRRRSPRTSLSPSATAPTRSARCEIDLSPGTRRSPRTAAAGSIRIPTSSSARARPERPGGFRRLPPQWGREPPNTNGIEAGRTDGTRKSRRVCAGSSTARSLEGRLLVAERRARSRPSSPAPRAARPPRWASASPATRIASVPPRSGDMWRRSKSSMLIPSAPSACVIPERTPGRSGMCTLEPAAASRDPDTPRPAAAAGAARPRRSSAPGSPRRSRRARARAPRRGAGARRARREARRRSRGRCRPRSAGSRRRRGSCPAATRRRRRAARARPRATEPTWFMSTFASACGTWLVSATSRSCARGSTATGTAPSDGDEPVQRAVALRVGLGHRRQEPGRAVEELRRSRARARAPRSRRSDGRR